MLSRELGLPVINTASAGDMTAEALAAISDAVWIKIPRLVIVLLGGKIFCARCVPGDAKKSRRNRPAHTSSERMVTIAGVKLGLFTERVRLDF